MDSILYERSRVNNIIWDILLKYIKYTTQNLLMITFSTVCYFCVFVINMKIYLKELNIISASCT